LAKDLSQFPTAFWTKGFCLSIKILPQIKAVFALLADVAVGGHGFSRISGI